MLLPVLRSAALAAAFSLASLAASAQTFGEFLNNKALPVTFLGVDFSAVKYYGPPLTVDQNEMKGEFTRINELLVREARKYDIAGALRREVPVEYTINVAETVNKPLDASTLIVPSDAAHRAPFTSQTVADMVTRYTLPAGSAGVGLVFVVEDINKNTEREVFWATFVDLRTKQVLFARRMAAEAMGFGFRNHWAYPLNSGIKTIEEHYGQWKKEFAKK